VSTRKKSKSNDTVMEFCTLKYGLPASDTDADSGTVVLLAVKDASTLRLYRHKALEQRTADRDLRYMNELLPDLLARSKRAPEEAFRQLSRLSFGPLVTDTVGQWNFSTDPVESLYPELELIGRKLPSRTAQTVISQ